MAITKSLYQAPTGMDEGMDDSDLQIEIENPDSVTMSDGSVEVTLEPESKAKTSKNLAEDMDEGELQSISDEIMELVDADVAQVSHCHCHWHAVSAAA